MAAAVEAHQTSGCLWAAAFCAHVILALHEMYLADHMTGMSRCSLAWQLNLHPGWAAQTQCLSAMHAACCCLKVSEMDRVPEPNLLRSRSCSWLAALIDALQRLARVAFSSADAHCGRQQRWPARLPAASLNAEQLLTRAACEPASTHCE